MAKNKVTEAKEKDLQEDIARYETKLEQVKSDIDTTRSTLFDIE